MSSTRTLQSQTLLQPALSQIFQRQLRDQNRVFPLRLVDVKKADEIFLRCLNDMTRHTSKFVSAI